MPIIEAGFLRNYLSGGKILTGMAFVPNSGRIATQGFSYYDNEKSAAENFERELAAPRVLAQFLDRISWDATELPTLVHGLTHLEVPLLQDITDHERARVEDLIADLQR